MPPSSRTTRSSSGSSRPNDAANDARSGSRHTGEVRRRRSRRTSKQERAIVYAAGVAAGACAVFLASTAPAHNSVANALWRGLVVGGVTVVASRARRWTWLVLCGTGALVAESGIWLGVGVVGLLVAFASVLLPRRRAYGAISCGLGMQALLHATGSDVGRIAPVVAVGAILPVLVSGYRASPRRVRRRIHVALAGAGAFVVLAAVAWGVGALLALPATSKGGSLAKEGLSEAREGKTDRGASLLGEAAAELQRANGLVSGPWAKPALAIPGLAQQAHALEVGTSQGAKLAELGANTSQLVDYDDLRYTKGRTDLAKIRSVQEPLRRTSEAFDEAERELKAADSDLLVGPVSNELDKLLTEVRGAKEDAHTASMAVDVAPAMLGGDGVRHYMVMFTTPAEMRGLGGFMGNWAILTADNGKLDLGESGRVRDLNRDASREIKEPTGPEDFLLRYQRWHVEQRLQDITVSPDFPTVASVMGELYPQAGGIKLDGAIVVDPYGLAALLELTGPVTVDGYPDPLTKDNVAEVLLTKQYLDFGDRELREQFLDAALRKPFEKLTDMSLPSPQVLGKVLGDASRERRLLFWTYQPKEQEFLTRIGASGAFGAPDGHDFLAITTQNSGNNKIDVYFKRKIEYAATYDPATGKLAAKAKVTLKNGAPATGLPEAIIGDNDKGFPDGTNAVYFSFYTPHSLREARVDNLARGVEFQRELGQNVYSTRVVMPAGTEAVLEFDLTGQLPPGTAYSLDYLPQPTVNPDELSVEVTPAPLWMASKTRSNTNLLFSTDIGGVRAILSASPKERTDVVVNFQKR